MVASFNLLGLDYSLLVMGWFCLFSADLRRGDILVFLLCSTSVLLIVLVGLWSWMEMSFLLVSSFYYYVTVGKEGGKVEKGFLIPLYIIFGHMYNDGGTSGHRKIRVEVIGGGH